MSLSQRHEVISGYSRERRQVIKLNRKRLRKSKNSKIIRKKAQTILGHPKGKERERVDYC